MRVQPNIIRIATLNARSIIKVSNTKTSKHFTNYLRSKTHQYDIICLQEVISANSAEHLSENHLKSLCYLFPNSSAVYTKHCAIICLNPKLKLINEFITFDERCINATVINGNSETLFHITTIYAPAQPQERLIFFNNLHSLPSFGDMSNLNEPWFYLGDFNISSLCPTKMLPRAISEWGSWLHSHFSTHLSHLIPTFKRGESTRSTIDYIYHSLSCSPLVTNPQHHFLPSNWTDHSILSIDFHLPRQDLGPGCYRLNPNLLNKDLFCQLLLVSVQQYFLSDYQNDTNICPQDKWESLKKVIRGTAKSFSKSYYSHLDNDIRLLQMKRSGLLDSPSATRPTNSNLLSDLEQLIEEKIQNETNQNLLRSATRWHEQGERNNKYFNNVIKQRTSHRLFSHLEHPMVLWYTRLTLF